MKSIRDYPTVPHEDEMDGMKLSNDQKEKAALDPDTFVFSPEGGKTLKPGMEKFISFKDFMKEQNKSPKNIKY